MCVCVFSWPATISVKSKPFFTDFLLTWLGRDEKPTYCFSWGPQGKKQKESKYGLSISDQTRVIEGLTLTANLIIKGITHTSVWCQHIWADPDAAAGSATVISLWAEGAQILSHVWLLFSVVKWQNRDICRPENCNANAVFPVLLQSYSPLQPSWES